ncbi:ABC transporter ATP-binding protein [Paenibacillus cymbidii]|uniref:ABC transporter ATP-binding protein n=1 Tax=Paenibacillus cymbidii TaxID=1639034 RepID=UPI001A9C0F34|nr:dipeptide ABC transporter ATP-binding protein [Paenibacillus cymbidii]
MGNVTAARGAASGPAVPSPPPLVQVEGLSKHFATERKLFGKPAGTVKAVNGLTFDIRDGETFALVGESGCGKSTASRLILRLLDPTSGTVKFQGNDLFALSRKRMREMRRHMQIIFQDPFGSLNPRMKIQDIIAEPLVAHREGNAAARLRRVKELMQIVGLSEEMLQRYPHEFSGGQRQRISIARALALQPKLVVCDEAVSALDVSIQAQVLNLLQELQQRFGLTYLFVSHNLSVVHHIADRVGVMYLGRLVELGEVDAIFNQPAHPYTQALLSAIPEIEPERRRERILLQGDLPSPTNPPSGCPFHTRCPYAQPRCETTEPMFRETADGHWSACHYPLAAMT